MLNSESDKQKLCTRGTQYNAVFVFVCIWLNFAAICICTNDLLLHGLAFSLIFGSCQMMGIASFVRQNTIYGICWLCTCLFTATILPTYHVFLAANKFHLASTGSVIAYTMFAKEIILFLSLRVKHGKFDSSLPILSGLDKAILLIVFLWLVVNYACFGLQEDIAKTTNGMPPQSIRSILYFSPAFILAFNSYLLLNN
mgnify:CR=1 FL=1